MIASGYTLDLYCEHEGCARNRSGGQWAPVAFCHELRSVCISRARKAGWVINFKEGTCWCPDHKNERRKASGASHDRDR